MSIALDTGGPLSAHLQPPTVTTSNPQPNTLVIDANVKTI